MNEWVSEQTNPDTSLEAKMTKLEPSYFRHIMRGQYSLEKTIIVGKLEGS